MAAQGRGGFGAVYEGRWRGRRVAVKRVPPQEGRQSGEAPPEAQHAALVAETRLSARFRHSRLVRPAARLASEKNPAGVAQLMMRHLTSIRDLSRSRFRSDLTAPGSRCEWLGTDIVKFSYRLLVT